MIKKKTEKNKDVLPRNGYGLGYRKDIGLNIRAVNNGYLILHSGNEYVFSDVKELHEFLVSILPVTGLENKFLRSLDSEDDLRDDLLDEDDLPF